MYLHDFISRSLAEIPERRKKSEEGREGKTITVQRQAANCILDLKTLMKRRQQPGTDIRRFQRGVKKTVIVVVSMTYITPKSYITRH